jgi:SAM-dependent methyltransferase
MSAAEASLSPVVDEFFREVVPNLVEVLRQIEDEVPPEVPADSEAIHERLTAAIDQCLSACEAVAERYHDDPEGLHAVQARFRDEVRNWFQQSWFMHRGLTKPRGFAGDYHILNAIYDNVPKSGGIGGYLDRYFLNSDLAKAVRARLQCVQEFVVQEALAWNRPLTILDVASGPGREFTDVFKRSGAVIQLKCLDIDQEALDHLRDRVQAASDGAIEVSCHRYNALRMSNAAQTVRHFGECDVIYSVGLCDYIPDRQLIAILRGWREAVSPQGLIYVAFKDVTRHRPAQNQWLVDWHFVPRVESDCRRLFSEAGYDVDELSMFRDNTNVIMNFVARSAAMNRTVGAHYDSTARGTLSPPADEVVVG